MNIGRAHQHRGSRTEAKVVSELLDRGISVCTPVFGHERHDSIIDRSGTLERVQVKTAHDHHGRNDTIVIEFDTTVYGSDGSPRRTFYSAEEIDSYLAYHPEDDVILYVPFEDTPRTQMNFSFRDAEEYNEHNRKAINFVSDYRLDVRL
ncbi:MAG: group I intron-associated PD-(D/E)XK endonuclease [Halobacteriales archaeon]